MVIQGHKIYKYIDVLSWEPTSEENENTNLGISVEVFEDLSMKSIDDLGHLLLNEDKLQQGEERTWRY